jgi:hypothetical protein
MIADPGAFHSPFRRFRAAAVLIEAFVRANLLTTRRLRRPFGCPNMRPVKILPASLLAAALALPLASASRAALLINIDKSTQQMTVAVDGEPRYDWPVSTGRPGYDTPNGNFRPNRMDADHFSQEWDNAPMPHTIFFDNLGHAIHGFFDVKHLGLAVSHGCVRLSPPNAAVLFDLVKAEGMGQTRVIIAGRTPGGEDGPVARDRLPINETLSSGQPEQIAPAYGQQPAPHYGELFGRSYSSEPDYGQSYQQPRYFRQPANQQRGLFQPSSP